MPVGGIPPMPTHGPTPACPRCGYDRSGEVATWIDRCPVRGVCPECGEDFAWSAKIDKETSRLRWSFEHATTLRWMAVGWVLAPVRCVLPHRYWRRMWNPEPVRFGRITVFLVVWWVMVRTVCSALMSVGLVLDRTGPITRANWRWNANGYHAGELVRYFGRGLKGSLPLVGTAGWDTADGIEYWFIAGLALMISVVWAGMLALGVGLPRASCCSRARVARALLMSLVIVPVAYESTRLLGALQSLWFTSPPDAYLIGGVVVSVVWVLAWWSVVTRYAAPATSGLALGIAHVIAVLVGGALHIGIYTGLLELIF